MGVVAMQEEIKKSETKENEEILKKAQEVVQAEYQKDSNEFSQLINNWLRNKGYAIDYQILFGNVTDKCVFQVLPRLLKVQKQNG